MKTSVISSEQLSIVSTPIPKVTKEIENVLDNQLVLTSTGGYQKLLVKWKGQLWFDFTTLDFQRLNPDLYRQ